MNRKLKLNKQQLLEYLEAMGYEKISGIVPNDYKPTDILWWGGGYDIIYQLTVNEGVSQDNELRFAAVPIFNRIGHKGSYMYMPDSATTHLYFPWPGALNEYSALFRKTM